MYVRETDDYILEVWYENGALFAMWREKPELIECWKMIRQPCKEEEIGLFIPILEAELIS